MRISFSAFQLSEEMRADERGVAAAGARDTRARGSRRRAGDLRLGAAVGWDSLSQSELNFPGILTVLSEFQIMGGSH